MVQSPETLIPSSMCRAAAIRILTWWDIESSETKQCSKNVPRQFLGRSGKDRNKPKSPKQVPLKPTSALHPVPLLESVRVTLKAPLFLTAHCFTSSLCVVFHSPLHREWCFPPLSHGRGDREHGAHSCKAIWMGSA